MTWQLTGQARSAREIRRRPADMVSKRGCEGNIGANLCISVESSVRECIAMPSKTGIDSDCYGYGLRNQEHCRRQGEAIVDYQAAANLESRYQAGQDDDDSDDKKDITGDDDHGSTIFGRQFLESWVLRCCLGRHLGQGLRVSAVFKCVRIVAS